MRLVETYLLPEKRERRRRGERYVEADGEGTLRSAVGVVFLLGRRRRRRGVDPFDREDLPVAAVLSDRTREVARLAGLFDPTCPVELPAAQFERGSIGEYKPRSGCSPLHGGCAWMRTGHSTQRARAAKHLGGK